MTRKLLSPIAEASPGDAARAEALGRLLPLWPHEIADSSIAGQERICRLLASGLRRERQRGVAGHWAYDVCRHAALVRALAPELRRLARMRAASRTDAWWSAARMKPQRR